MRHKLLALALGTIALCACSTHPVMQNLDSFHHVYVFGSTAKLNVILTQDSICQFGITGNNYDSANVYVRNDTLFAMFRKVDKGQNTIHICSRQYKSIIALLVNHLTSTNTLMIDSLDLEVSAGKGKTDLQLLGNRLCAEWKTISHVKLAGKCKEAYITTPQLGKFNALDLEVEDVYLQTDCRKVIVNATKNLCIEKAFLSTISYINTPEITIRDFKYSTLKYEEYLFPSKTNMDIEKMP